MLDPSSLVACHECDLLHERSEIAYGAAARCAGCGARLYRRPRDSIQRALTLSIASLVLFVVANVYPFLYFKIEGRVEVNTMATGVIRLYEWDMWPLAAVIAMASIVAPGLKIALMLYLTAPLHANRVPSGAATAMHWLRRLGPWGMLEVYMLGVLIGIVNLIAMASIVLGVAFYAFVALMIVSTAAGAAFDPDVVWRRVEKAK